MSHDCCCGGHYHAPQVEEIGEKHVLHPLAAAPAPLSVAADLFAGSLAGAAQVIVGQPLDTVRVRLQTASSGTFKGTWDVLSKTTRYEGATGLFKGMASPLYGIAAQNSLLFAAFEESKRSIALSYGIKASELDIPQIALAGSIAGSVNAVLASPVEQFKIKMQVQYAHPQSGSSHGSQKQLVRLSQVAKRVWSQYGFRQGVMRGYWVTVAREAPAYAGFYAGFESGKQLFRHHVPSALVPAHDKSGQPEQLRIWALMLSGSLGGISNWLACYPIDVIKSHVQQSTLPLPRFYILPYAREIWAESGPRGFLRGLTPTLLRSIPAAAATFTTYELVRGGL